MNNNESAIVNFYYSEGVTKFVFYSSEIKKSESLYQGEMVDIGGLSVNAMPYTSNGICLENAVYDTKYGGFSLTLKNENNFAISNYSHIEYKVYNADNFVIRSASVYTTHLNSNEKCIKSFYLPEGATKVVFGKAVIKETEPLTVDSLAVYESIEMNTLPYITSGLKIEEFVSIDKYGSMTLKIRNVTGGAIESGAWINYQCYNADGVILSANSLLLYTLNNNETQLYTTSLPKDTVKVVFFNANCEQIEAKKDFAVAEINGIEINKYPVTINGLTIENIEVNDDYYRAFNITVVNNTGKNLTDMTNLRYCCYDADGNVVKDTSTYVERLNKYEETDVTVYYTETTAKIVIYDATIYAVEE